MRRRGWLGRITDVVVGLGIAAALVVCFIPFLIYTCVEFTRSKRTGEWR